MQNEKMNYVIYFPAADTSLSANCAGYSNIDTLPRALAVYHELRGGNGILMQTFGVTVGYLTHMQVCTLIRESKEDAFFNLDIDVPMVYDNC